MIVTWSPNLSSAEIIQRLTPTPSRSSPRNALMTLHIDGNFFTSFMLMDESEREQVLNVLKTSPVQETRFHDLGLPSPRASKEGESASLRMRELCLALGSLSTLDEANYSYATCDAWMSDIVFKHLTHVTTVKLTGTNSENLDSTMVSLQGFSTIKCLILLIPTHCYSQMLPLLSRMGSLEEIRLRTGNYGRLSLLNATGVVQVLQSKLPVQIVLQHFTFNNAEAHSVLLHGIATANVRGIDLSGGKYEDPAPLLSAVASCRIKSFRFTRALSFKTGGNCNRIFYSTLAETLSSMTQLEELGCELLTGVVMMGQVDQADDDVLIKLIKAVTRHPSIKSFKFDIEGCTNKLDAALADCVRQNGQLTELQILNSSDVQSMMPNTLPKFLDAVKLNYTLRSIHLTDLDLSLKMNHWDSNFKQSVETLVKLNVAGRSYLSDGSIDTCHQREGLIVLERVNQDLDCIFVHLLENPYLCKGDCVLPVAA
ncbi:hypothetical protein MPSEU_000989100 [Mayamaea pseudoterrestris]|nr:hypothetical protein MPSEU_000989100 [Mayamaea pseudoterrestris]